MGDEGAITVAADVCSVEVVPRQGPLVVRGLRSVWMLGAGLARGFLPHPSTSDIVVRELGRHGLDGAGAAVLSVPVDVESVQPTLQQIEADLERCTPEQFRSEWRP